MAELLSKRQLLTIANIGKHKKEIHYGPFGCGKTFSICMGVGLLLRETPPPPGDGIILVVGKTMASAKANVCSVWASLFGKNFRYDSGKKDGYEKDGFIFGHRFRLVGLNDASAEDRIRGANAYLIIGDEISTWSKDNFDRILGRLRGVLPQGWDDFFFVGSTNPDSPIHWLKKEIDTSNDIHFVKWSEFDNITSGAEAYYKALKDRYRSNRAYYLRYVMGEWAAAEGLVYSCFSEEDHILTVNQISQLDFVEYRLGVDFGLNNPTAILLLGRTVGDEWVVLQEKYLPKTTLTNIYKAFVQIMLDKPIKTIFLDPSALALKDKLKENGIYNFKNANNSVKEGIQLVYDYFTTQRLFISEECVSLKGELLTYCYKKDGSDDVKKEYDHACDALRYALMGERGE